MMYHSYTAYVSGAGSGVCELTNQGRLGVKEREALKRQALKQQTKCDL